MTDHVVVYECGHGNTHAAPGVDVRVLKVGDGGFIIACACGPEGLAEADEQPHADESTDHLANVYYDDPQPADWLVLEDAADGWYDVHPHEPTDDPDLDGTHAQRREQFRRKVEAAADTERRGFDAERNDPENKSARKVACPDTDCGAGAGQPCKRPSGHTVQKVHVARKEAAREAGVLETDTEPGEPDELAQTSIGRWQDA